MNRRRFLLSTAISTGLSLLPLGRNGWAAIDSKPIGSQRLVVIFLRGAVDGLNVVVPYGETAYYDGRPTIALAKPGEDGGVSDLDGYFGLHPALASLMPLWRQGALAFVHAAGSPDPTRSHFDAQDYMESGTPGVKTTPDGWMNRLLESLPGPHSPTEAVSFGPTLPRIFSGRMNVANLPMGRAAARPMPLDRPLIAAEFDRLYAGDGPLDRAYREGRSARSQLLSELQQDMKEADNGAPTPAGFPADAQRLARLIAGNGNIRLAFLALGGWDTHVNQGAAQGQLANHLRPLGEGLAALTQGLGPEMRNTVILVMSEFGRTVRENGNGGTDHGHGNTMWLMGGPVRGGKVYGDWPGLDGQGLYQGRDLAVTTDFRAVASAVAERHLGLTDRQLDHVFPDMPQGAGSLARLFNA